jgi:hypothetical protein
MVHYKHLFCDIELLVIIESNQVENIVYTSLEGNKVMKDGKHLFTVDLENRMIDFGEDFEEVSCSFSCGRPVRPYLIKKSDLLDNILL